METILFLAHTEPEHSLSRHTLEALSAAQSLSQSLGANFIAALIGENVQPAANQIASSGAKRLLGIAGAEFAQPRYGSDAAAAEALARAAQATIIIAPATSRWNRVLPGVVHRLQGRADTHVTGVNAANGLLSVNRWYYRQRLEATLQRTQRPWCLL